MQFPLKHLFINALKQRKRAMLSFSLLRTGTNLLECSNQALSLELKITSVSMQHAFSINKHYPKISFVRV